MDTMVTPTGTLKVVLADDCPDVLYLLERTLSATSDVEVLAEVHDGAAAIREVLAHAADCLVVDLRMPGTDGLHAIRALRRHRRDLAIVLLTGDHDTRARTMAAELGADAVVSKFDAFTQLELRLREAVELRRSLTSGRRSDSDAHPARLTA